MLLAFFKKRRDQKQLRHRDRDLASSLRYSLRVDDDLLSEEQKTALHQIQDDLALLHSSGPDAIPEDEPLSKLELRYDAITRRRNSAANMRNILDIVVVAVSVAFGVRAIFLQPFKIPTSSMQPTLFGVHYIDRDESAPYSSELTKRMMPLAASRALITARTPGELKEGAAPFMRTIPDLLMNLFSPADLYLAASRVMIGDELYTLPGTDVRNDIYRYLDAMPEGREFAAGERFLDGFVSSGDHLFVDRLSLHFADLKRGEVFVFNTEGIIGPNGRPIPGYYYIKRLVGMPGDTLKIIDHVLYIKPEGENEFRRADEFSERFKKIYSGKGGYHGHIPVGLLADGNEFKVPANSYFAMGDNSNNSLDSRSWGVVPRRNVIGRALNVFWPLSRRWGRVDSKEPIDVESRIPEHMTQPTAMRLQ